MDPTDTANLFVIPPDPPPVPASSASSNVETIELQDRSVRVRVKVQVAGQPQRPELLHIIASCRGRPSNRRTGLPSTWRHTTSRPRSSVSRAHRSSRSSSPPPPSPSARTRVDLNSDYTFIESPTLVRLRYSSEEASYAGAQSLFGRIPPAP